MTSSPFFSSGDKIEQDNKYIHGKCGRKATLKSLIQSLRRYVRASGEDDSACFVKVSITDIMKDMMSSNVFAGSSRTTHVRSNTIGKLMIKHRNVPSSLLNLGKEVPAATGHGITNHDDIQRCFSVETFFMRV